MDQATLIDNIVTTKNTLTILHRVFIANQVSLQQFSPIFDSITELIDILTHSSVKQIETALLSTGSESVFNNLKDTLNELSDAITTKNTSLINNLNEQLNSYVEKLRICSSHEANNEETADDIFKKQVLQSNIDAKVRLQSDVSKAFILNAEYEHHTLESISHQSECSDNPKIPVSHVDYNAACESPPPCSELEQAEKKSSIIDRFAQFRFARRRHSPTSFEDHADTYASAPSSSSLPQHAISHPSKPLSSKPRLMISYNHASKPLCIEIYNKLTNDGYDVWIDLKEMHGSTLVAMAQGIEDSDIFLFCITENYSQSPNCQKEAEYAFVRQKIMIPLLLQSKYKPTGWLGLLLGASLYIDFTKDAFTQSYEKLKNEIVANAMRISSNTNDAPKLTLDSITNDKEQTQTRADNSQLQSTQINSQSTVTKSRGCVLF